MKEDIIKVWENKSAEQCRLEVFGENPPHDMSAFVEKPYTKDYIEHVIGVPNHLTTRS